MIEAERFLEEKLKRGKTPVDSSETPAERAVVRPPDLPRSSGQSSARPEVSSRWSGLKYVVAVLACVVTLVLFCFVVAAARLKGYLVFAFLFLVIIPGVWFGVLAMFDKKTGNGGGFK